MSKTKQKANGKRVSAEAFVLAWKKGGTIADVAERAGCSVLTASGCAHRYRALGIKLPKLERLSGPRLDPAALNALLAK